MKTLLALVCLTALTLYLGSLWGTWQEYGAWTLAIGAAAIVLPVAGWVLLSRDNEDDRYLKAGLTPPSWHSAYPRDHRDQAIPGESPPRNH